MAAGFRAAGADTDDGKIQFIRQPGTPGVIDVDDGRSGFPAGRRCQKIGKEPFLAVVIGGHIRVIIKVVLGQVGENARIKPAPVHPELVQAVGGHFHDDMGDAGLFHF